MSKGKWSLWLVRPLIYTLVVGGAASWLTMGSYTEEVGFTLVGVCFIALLLYYWGTEIRRRREGKLGVASQPDPQSLSFLMAQMERVEAALHDAQVAINNNSREVEGVSGTVAGLAAGYKALAAGAREAGWELKGGPVLDAVAAVDAARAQGAGNADEG